MLHVSGIAVIFTECRESETTQKEKKWLGRIGRKIEGRNEELKKKNK